MSNTRLLMYHNSVISYVRFGEGPNVLVAFHGYDQCAADFLYFEEVLREKYTVIAIDFFWHGDSKWLELRDFTSNDLKRIVLGIKVQEQLKTQTFSVCSFSMGARLARALVRSFPQHICHLIFIAPPTFAFNTFLNFTTRTKLGLYLFSYFIKHQGSLSYWVHKLYKTGILNRPIYVFTSKFIGKSDRLQKVFNTWYAQRALTTNFNLFFKLLDEYNIRTSLIVGTLDNITPPRKMAARIQKLKQGQVYLLNQHHQLATPLVRDVLNKILNNEPES